MAGVKGGRGGCSRASGSSITVESLIPAVTPQVPITNTLRQVNALIDEFIIRAQQTRHQCREARCVHYFIAHGFKLVHTSLLAPV